VLELGFLMMYITGFVIIIVLECIAAVNHNRHFIPMTSTATFVVPA